MSGICQRCTAPTGDGATLCWGCTDCGLDTHQCRDDRQCLAHVLRQARDLTPDLVAAVGRQRGNGVKEFTKHRGYVASEHSLPVDVGAIAVGRELWDFATMAGGMVMRGIAEPEPTTAAVVALLDIARERIDVLRHEDDVLDLLTSGRSIVGAMRRSVQPMVLVGYIGSCQCGAALYGPTKARETVCQRCGLTHDTAEARSNILEKAESQWASRRWAEEWLKATGVEMPPRSTIDTWISAGKIATNADGFIVTARLREKIVKREEALGLRRHVA